MLADLGPECGQLLVFAVPPHSQRQQLQQHQERQLARCFVQETPCATEKDLKQHIDGEISKVDKVTNAFWYLSLSDEPEPLERCFIGESLTQLDQRLPLLVFNLQPHASVCR